MSGEQLREQAARLLALSLRARENGRRAYADELAAQASEYLERAARADEAPPPPGSPKPANTQGAQQQQQPQQDKRKK